MLLVAWTGKFFVVLLAMLIYEQHYGLDAYWYFQLPLTGQHWMYPGIDFREDMIPSLNPLRDAAGRAIGGGIGTENFVRFVLLLASVTGPYYHAMKVGFAFMGLIGVWWFYRVIVVALGRPYPAAFYLLAFFPSILFWSSILGKDPLQFLFLGLYAYGGAIWLVQGRLTGLWVAGAGMFGVYLLRPWITGMAGAALFLATLVGRFRGWQVVLMLPACGLAFFLSWEQALPLLSAELTNIIREDPTMVLEVIEKRSQGFAQDTRGSGGSGGDLGDLAAGRVSLPWAMFTGLFRPLPFDITSLFTALAAIENTVVLLLSVVAIHRMRFAYLRDPLVVWLVAFSLLWTLLHGFIVMGNFGSGVRYKLQVWPFLLMAILIFVHKDGRALLESRAFGRKRHRDAPAG